MGNIQPVLLPAFSLLCRCQKNIPGNCSDIGICIVTTTNN